jgi:hypothetical protein
MAEPGEPELQSEYEGQVEGAQEKSVEGSAREGVQGAPTLMRQDVEVYASDKQPAAYCVAWAEWS